jgi:hypothetical protein
MPNAVPEFADVYGLDPFIIIGGDAHNALRRSAVVRVGTPYVTTIGRSTSEQHRPPQTLRSEIDLECNLDKVGVFSLRWQHSVESKTFDNPSLCTYYGHLKSSAKSELREFWDNAAYV